MGLLIVVIVGLATGFAASILFWLWQARLFQPKMQICPALANYTLPNDPNKELYCDVTFINRGHRAAADLTITVHAVVPGLLISGEGMYLRLREERWTWTDPGRSEAYVLSLSRMAHEDKEKYGPRLPEPIARSLCGEAPEVSIKEFLTICVDSRIEVYVTASDSFFGGRSFDKHIFRKDDFSTDNDIFRKGKKCGYEPCCQEPRLSRIWRVPARAKVDIVSEFPSAWKRLLKRMPRPPHDDLPVSEPTVTQHDDHQV